MRSAVLFLTALVLVACVSPETVTCADGRTCPGGSVCDDTHALCVSAAQLTACADLAEADACTAGTFEGLCDQGVCIAGCGDHTQSSGEECDDGNHASHDGCSSTCVLETPSWRMWEDAWTPRSRHATAFLEARGTLVVFGGADDTSIIDQQWERDAQNAWRPVVIPRPSARASAAMAYDADRGVIVLFGGVDATGTLDDTWTYDGQAWTKLLPQASPPPRAFSAMAYAGSGRVVLFGGINETSELADTWEFDGTTWLQKLSATAPSARRLHAMTWAPFANNPRVVMCGGVVVAGIVPQAEMCWEYTSSGGWTVIPAATPPRRYGVSLAYSQPDAAVILYGGGTNAESLSDTWRYDGAAWSGVLSAQNPPGRSEATMTSIGAAGALLLAGAAAGSGSLDDAWLYTTMWVRGVSPGNASVRGDMELVFDDQRRESFVIGGYREPGPTVETYAFDGTGWTRDTDIPPPARYRFAAAYDGARQRMMLFGGSTYGGVPVAATTVRDGAQWSRLVGTEPPPRIGGAMAYAASTQQVVLFGGVDADTVYGDTWVFDGNWRQLPVDGPPPQGHPAMAYDAAKQRVVLFSRDGATWALTQTGWAQLFSDGPPARTSAAMQWSPELQRIVLYGGVRAAGTVTELLTDMWQLTESGWQEIVPAGVTPPARGDPRITAHRPFRELLLHAGTLSSGRRLNDTWLFQFRSDTPDELCANGTDDDGDRRIDERDPDCTR